MLLLLKGIKDQPGFVLYGNPPRWHKYDASKHTDKSQIHHHAKKTTEIQAAKKLKDAHNSDYTKSAEEKKAHMLAEAKVIQDKASASAAITGAKKALLAGKAPSKSQFLALSQLLETDKEKAQKIVDSIVAEIGPEAYHDLIDQAAGNHGVEGFEAKAKAPEPEQKKEPEKTVKFEKQGDFYELFGDEAKTVADAIGKTAVKVQKGDSKVWNIGIPYHQVEQVKAKLADAGIKADFGDDTKRSSSEQEKKEQPSSLDAALQKLESLPQGGSFETSKNITSLFNKAKESHNETLVAFENGEDDASVVDVDINDIEVTQPNVTTDKIEAFLKKDSDAPPIPGVKFGNKVVIVDGHHRLVTEKLKGAKTIKVKLVDPNGAKVSKSDDSKPEAIISHDDAKQAFWAFAKESQGAYHDFEDLDEDVKNGTLKGDEIAHAALEAFSGGAFIELNSDPNHPAAKALLDTLKKQEPAPGDKSLYRVVAFDTAEEQHSFVAALHGGNSQERTLSSWTHQDPTAQGQTPTNNIALDVASQFGNKRVLMKLVKPSSARDISYIYGESVQPGLEQVLLHGTRLDVHDMLEHGDDLVVTLKEVKEGDTKTENGHTYVLQNGRWHRTDKDQPAAKDKGAKAEDKGADEDAIIDGIIKTKQSAYSHTSSSSPIHNPDKHLGMDDPEAQKQAEAQAKSLSPEGQKKLIKKMQETWSQYYKGFNPDPVDMPDFDSYSEATAWAKKRAKSTGISFAQYQVTAEYHYLVYPKLHSLWQKEHEEFVADEKEHGKEMQKKLADAGLKVGSKVKYTAQSMLGQIGKGFTYTGTVYLNKHGVPTVKVPGGVDVKDGNKIKVIKSIPWEAHWKSAEAKEPKPQATEAEPKAEGEQAPQQAQPPAAPSKSYLAAAKEKALNETASLFLHESNSNAGTVAKKVAKLQQMIHDHDLEGMTSAKWGSNNYGKKIAAQAAKHAATLQAAAARDEAKGASADEEPKGQDAGETPEPQQPQPSTAKTYAGLTPAEHALVDSAKHALAAGGFPSGSEAFSIYKLSPSDFADFMSETVQAGGSESMIIDDLKDMLQMSGMSVSAKTLKDKLVAGQGGAEAPPAATPSLNELHPSYTLADNFVTKIEEKIQDGTTFGSASAQTWAAHIDDAIQKLPAGDAHKALKNALLVAKSILESNAVSESEKMDALADTVKHKIRDAIVKAPKDSAPGGTLTPEAASAKLHDVALEMYKSIVNTGNAEDIVAHANPDTLKALIDKMPKDDEHKALKEAMVDITGTLSSSDTFEKMAESIVGGMAIQNLKIALAKKALKDNGGDSMDPGYKKGLIDGGMISLAEGKAPSKMATLVLASMDHDDFIEVSFEKSMEELNNIISFSEHIDTLANVQAQIQGKISKTLKESLDKVLINQDGGSADAGPKEGDTKTENGKTYILQNGRWHLLNDDQDNEPLTKEKAIEGWKHRIKNEQQPNPAHAHFLYKELTHEELQQLLGDTAKELASDLGTMPSVAEMIVHTLHGDAIDNYNAENIPDWEKELFGNAPVSGAQPAAEDATPIVHDIDGWTEHPGTQGGYNTGGIFTDEHGVDWYCKWPSTSDSDDVVKTEALAMALYAAAGANVPHVKLITKGGKLGLASKMVKDAKEDKAALQQGALSGLFDDFAADAWLANYDTVGNNPAKGFDNILNHNGFALRIDAGGALDRKGTGGKKPFGNDVGELKSLRDGAINKNAASVFGKMTEKQVEASVARVAAIDDHVIESLVSAYGPGDDAAKAKMVQTLIARKKDMLKQYPNAAEKVNQSIQHAHASGGITTAKGKALGWKMQGENEDGSILARDKKGNNWVISKGSPGDELTIKHQLLGDKIREAFGVTKGFSQIVHVDGHLSLAKMGDDAVPKGKAKIASIVDAFLHDKPVDSISGSSAAAKMFSKLSNSQIHELVGHLETGDPDGDTNLIDKLVKKRSEILAHFNVRDPFDYSKVDKKNLAVNPSDIPTPIDFANFHAKSSKDWVNQQNTIDDKALIDFALKGDLEALEGYEYDAISKDTGESIGKKSILHHPSQYIKNHWTTCVDILDSIAHPPVKTVILPSFSKGVYDDLSEEIGYIEFGENPDTIDPDKAIGFFMKLGKIDKDDVADLVPKQETFYHKSKKHGSDSWFQSIPSAAKSFVHAVLGSGINNRIWKNTKKGSAAKTQYGVGIGSLASTLYENAVEHEEGMVIQRWMGMSDDMQKKLLDEGSGLVFQNTDSMCTSVFKDWGKGQQFHSDAFLKIRYAKGAKALDSHGTGKFNNNKTDSNGHYLHTPGAEMEITTLPGARFVVLEAKKGHAADPNGLYLDLLMLPPHSGFLADINELKALGKSILLFFGVKKPEAENLHGRQIKRQAA